ncbi:MAG: hypothetical protein HZB33_15645, partial [Nitrospirae bacterium]|nr:hypothetical protein [Nitrospirota bacterium]
MKGIVTTQKNFESGVYLCLVFITLLFNGLLLIPSTSNADAVEMSSSALASHYQSAEAKWKAHKWEEALSEYDIVAKSKSPYASKAHIQIGKYYKYHGLWDAAIEHYEEAISKALIVRDLEDAETSIAAVHLSKGDYKTAIDMFTDIISKTQDWEQVKYCTYWIKELRRRLSYGDGACNTCGQNALMELLKLKGIKVLKSDIEKGLKLSEDGASMEAMKQYAMTKGLKVNGVKLTLEELKNADMPLIALIDNPKHYIIVTKVAPNDIHVINPEIGLEPFSIPNKEFKKIWKGQALIFTDKNLEGEIALLSSNEMKALSGKVCFCCPAGNNGGPGQLPNTPFFPDPNSPGGSPPPGGCQPPGMPAISVNMANMNFLVQDTDLAYNGRGPGIKIQRTYNADSGLNGPFGKGWTFNYNVSLVENPGGSIDVTRETGTIHRFNSAGGGNYIPPKAIHDTLTKNGDGTYALRLKGSRHIQAFSATGRLTSITDRNGNSVTFQYNPDNSLASITDAVGRITTFNYGTNGKISSITDPQQRSVSFIYDAGDNLTSSTDMAGTTVSYSYDSNSYMTGITSPKGTTTIGYTTEFGAKWVSSILDPLGHTRSFQDIWPSGTSTTDANGNAVTYKSNGDAFAVTITDALGNTVNYGYDGDGNRNSIQDPNGHTTLLVYDARGNVTSITDPLTHSVQMIYDGNDNLTQLTDPALNTYIYEYDSHNNLTHITDPENGPTKKTILAYNSYGEVTTFTDPKGNPLTYIHDNQGNLTSATSPINGSDSYTYDAIGRALTHTDPKTNTTSYTYDGIDRVTEVRYQDQSIKSYTYDCCGPHTVIDQNGTLIFTHDNINRLTGFTDAYGKTIGYGHDFARNITSITYPDGKVVNYQYDEANRLTQV